MDYTEFPYDVYVIAQGGEVTISHRVAELPPVSPAASP